MLLLSIDTSGREGSLALAQIENSQIENLREVTWQKKAMHSEVATIELQNVLRAGGATLQDLTHLIVNIGPGSFTGLRVGISLAKTLAYSLHLQVFTINSLELLAFTHSQPGESIFVATKAIQNFYYAATFHHEQQNLRVGLAAHAVEGSSLPTLSANCTKVLIEGPTTSFSTQTRAADSVRFMLARGRQRPFSDWKSVEPLYIRASEAEEKLKRGLLKS